MKFSERYGYLKPSEVIIREQITPEIQNAICNCLHVFSRKLLHDRYKILERYIWCYFLNQRLDSFQSNTNLIKNYIQNNRIDWYSKLDIIETILSFDFEDYNSDAVNTFTDHLNYEFERLKFGYRVVENQIVEITSEEEIKAIETAIDENKENVKLHLNNALKLYAQRPEADYRNSIKESISAVEALSREITGDKGLSFAKMEAAGYKIPHVLRKSFEMLYGYTNNPTTGIRHALMNETAEYLPGADEALFMLVSCSAFINYLNSKSH